MNGTNLLCASKWFNSLLDRCIFIHEDKYHHPCKITHNGIKLCLILTFTLSFAQVCFNSSSNVKNENGVTNTARALAYASSSNFSNPAIQSVVSKADSYLFANIISLISPQHI